MSQRASRSDSDALGAIRAQAEPFLCALFGGFFERGLKGFIEIRIIGPGKKREQRFFPSIEAVLDALPQLKAANDAGADIYIGVNSRYHERGCQVDVEHVVALHADVDPEKRQPPATFGSIKPSIAVRSGNGFHYYWLLQDPALIDGEESRACVRGLNAAVSDAAGAADHCHDLGHVLRLPGFVNQKDPASPKPVELKAMDMGASRGIRQPAAQWHAREGRMLTAPFDEDHRRMISG